MGVKPLSQSVCVYRFCFFREEASGEKYIKWEAGVEAMGPKGERKHMSRRERNRCNGKCDMI